MVTEVSNLQIALRSFTYWVENLIGISNAQRIWERAGLEIIVTAWDPRIQAKKIAWQMGRKFICSDQWRLNAIGESTDANILEKGDLLWKGFCEKRVSNPSNLHLCKEVKKKQ